MIEIEAVTSVTAKSEQTYSFCKSYAVTVFALLYYNYTKYSTILYINVTDVTGRYTFIDYQLLRKVTLKRLFKRNLT